MGDMALAPDAGATCPPDMALAAELFDRLRADSADGLGVTRDAYGPGEQRAHDLIAQVAARLGLDVERDAALNTYVIYPGRDRAAARVMTGSHLDSVPAGGNFDGAAGVVAGMAVLAGWLRGGYVPPRDVAVMAVRAEESTWFPYSYLGSKAALGQVGRDALALPRADTGRTLAEHLRDCGGDPDRFGPAFLHRGDIARFVELHIEQGPVLVEAGSPVGIVTGIRGSLRYRTLRFVGEYAHSGAVPRAARRDAVRAGTLFMVRADQAWARRETAGDDMVLTFGICATDPAQHAFSKVAGELAVSLDLRSRDPAVLAGMDGEFHDMARDVEAETGTRIEFGAPSGSTPAIMDKALRDLLADEAHRQGIPVLEMASGAGHDAACFALAGVPTAMIFVRNEHGSHNPREAMDLADFEQGARLLEFLLRAV